MKRMVVWAILLCLLLCGCVQDMPEMTTEPTLLQTEPEDVAIPTGCYEADSEIALLTNSAIHMYTPDMEDITGFFAVDGDIFLFSGSENTVITKLSGNELVRSASIETGCPILSEDPSVLANQKGLSYYNCVSGEMVFLDAALREISRTKIPKDIIGSPVMTADRKTIYYCTIEGVRVLEIEDGLNRLLKQEANPDYIPLKLLRDDTILLCSVNTDTAGELIFISTQTGETIRQADEAMFVSTCADRYYAVTAEGAMQAMVFGNDQGSQMLIPRELWPAERWYLESSHAALTLSDVGRLDYYDLTSGKRASSVELADFSVDTLAADEQGFLYILGQHNGVTCLYKWDTAKTPTGDEMVYTSRRYTLSDPDMEGLKACQELAEAIGNKYNIEVLIAQNATAVQPWEYVLETEYQVPVIRQELEKLAAWLEAFPEDFLATAAKGTDRGIVRICLVRSVTGTPESGNPVEMEGGCFWIDENVYAAIPVGQTTEKTFYHTIFHVLETRIMSMSKFCYDWESHNPEGFAYDYAYGVFHDPADTTYLEGETRAFIDHFSMTFPREDRATIMAYAITEGNAEYFRSEIMQNKLTAICRGIRKAFGLEKSPEVFIWEQYLNKPLAKS